MRPAGVLMVTGAYWPELSGGGLQCRTMIRALGDQVRCRVFTTCTDLSLPAESMVEGTPVTRVYIDTARPSTKWHAAVATVRYFLTQSDTFEIVHLHGFSQKSILIALLARLFGKRLVITIHTAGSDEPAGVRALGRLAYWCYSRADRFVAISEQIAANYRAAGLPADRLTVAPNGVDTERFRPASEAERGAARRALGGLPPELPWLLFVGFFSRDKGPDVLFEAWLRLQQLAPGSSALLYVGATASAYHEVDAAIAREIQAEAGHRGLSHLVKFTGEMAEVERAYRAADILVMPSTREAFGMVLIEAMASGLPVVATRIDGVTDTIIDDGVSGLLVAPKDVAALTAAVAQLLGDRQRAESIGVRARQEVVARYGLEASATRWRQIYDEALHS